MNKRPSKTRHFWLLIPYAILLYGLVLLRLYIAGEPLPLNAEPTDIWWILGIGIVSSIIATFIAFFSRKNWLDDKSNSFWPDGRSDFE